MKSLFLHSFVYVIILIIDSLSLSFSLSLSRPPSLPPSLSTPCRLRTLSSGNSSSTSGGGGGSGGTSAGPPSPTKLPLSSSSSTASKKLHFKMAEHRYGKEELLQLFYEDPIRPPGMPTLFPITRDKSLTPLAFMPLSEDEQVRWYRAVKVSYSRKLSREKNFHRSVRSDHFGEKTFSEC